MDTLPFTDMIAEEITTDNTSFVQRIQKIWEDRNQFEEMVEVLLHEHDQNKPGDIFY
jgi:hypothetical protein